MRINHLIILCSISVGVLASWEWILVAIAAKSLETLEPTFVELSTRKLLITVGYAALGGGHLLDISKQCGPNDNAKKTTWEDCITAVLESVVSAAIVLGKYLTSIQEIDVAKQDVQDRKTEFMK